MSSNEGTKNSEQSHPPNYPTFSGPYPPPPGAYPPPFYTYAPPPDGAHGENGGQPGPHQYMMAFPPPPPGMVYAYPPPGQSFYQGQNNGKQTKRKQVKMACTNCAAACKRCDEARPCERCIKYGLTDQCQDGVRKERKKGVKRGPYKRKNKAGATDGSFGAFAQTDGEAGWQSSSTSPANTTAPAAAANSGTVHNVQYPPPGTEGYYPYYYPPHGYMAPSQATEPHVPTEHTSTQPGPNGQPPIQYFSVHTAGFTPFPAYPPPPGVPFTPINLPHMQQQTMDPKKANSGSHANRQESEEEADEEEESSPGPPPTLVPVPPQPIVPAPPPAPAPSQKKRARAARGATEPKAKKTKTSASKKLGRAAAAAAAKALIPDGHRSDDSDPVVSRKA